MIKHLFKSALKPLSQIQEIRFQLSMKNQWEDIDMKTVCFPFQYCLWKCFYFLSNKMHCLQCLDIFISFSFQSSMINVINKFYFNFCYLSRFSPVLHFISKPVIWFAVKIKWLVSIWNATLGWNNHIKPFVK